MTIETGTFELQLRRAIEVHGVDERVDTLTFKECGEGYDAFYMKLRKGVTSAMFKAPELMAKLRSFKEGQDDDDDGVAAGEEVKRVHEIDDAKHEDDSSGFAEVLKMALGTSDELEELVRVFGRMVEYTGGIAICEANGQRVKEGAWKRVHPEDKIDAAVRYCAFFGIGSVNQPNNVFGRVSDSHSEVKAL